MLNDRTKEKLQPIIKYYVHTNIDDVDLEINENAYDNIQPLNPEDYTIKTRIFSSDSFGTYQVSDFDSMGYILKRVNHSVWFGVGMLHTNTIESLWHQIKLL